MSEKKQPIRLRREAGRLVAGRDGDDEPVPVRVVCASPLRGPAGGVSILHASKKEELAYVPALAELDEASRTVVADELTRRYFLPKIRSVLHTRATFGVRYWQVQTDRGPRQFVMKSPETNTAWLSDDRCVLTDSLGNCYEIESLAALDRRSRKRVDLVL